MAKIKLPKWTQVYPQGTTTGDEEQRFFIALVRNINYTFRSIEALMKEAKLSRERVEQIILKYHKKKMIYQNPKSENQWGYWERVQKEMPNLIPDEEISLAKHNQKQRIDNKSKN